MPGFCDLFGPSNDFQRTSIVTSFVFAFLLPLSFFPRPLQHPSELLSTSSKSYRTPAKPSESYRATSTCTDTDRPRSNSSILPRCGSTQYHSFSPHLSNHFGLGSLWARRSSDRLLHHSFDYGLRLWFVYHRSTIFSSFSIVLLPCDPSTLHHSSLCLVIVRLLDDRVSSLFDFGSISCDLGSIMFDFDSIPFASSVFSFLCSRPFGSSIASLVRDYCTMWSVRSVLVRCPSVLVRCASCSLLIGRSSLSHSSNSARSQSRYRRASCTASSERPPSLPPPSTLRIRHPFPLSVIEL